jgi:hypothetical protein
MLMKELKKAIHLPKPIAAYFGAPTMQSTVVSTRGTPAAGHPARRGSDPVIADVRLATCVPS